VTGAAARITELLVRAGNGNGLTAGQLPAVDLDQLLRAVTPAATAAITANVPTVAQMPTEPAPTQRAEPTPRPSADAAPSAAEPPAAPTDAVATAGQAKKNTTDVRPRRSSSTTTTTARRTSASGAKSSARSSGTAKATKVARASKDTKARASKSSKAAPAKKTAAKTPAARERVYRRAPDDLAQVYQQAGSAAALADHYGVPRHTAYGWIRTLRRDNTTAAAS
jgi:hypothetical protein